MIKVEDLCKIKEGEFVRVINCQWYGKKSLAGKIGRVIFTSEEEKVMVLEFKENIGGHNGCGFSDDREALGKDGCCWGFFINEDDILKLVYRKPAQLELAF